MLEKRGNKNYVYRSIRYGDSVRRIYIGRENSPEAKQAIIEMKDKIELKEERDKLSQLSSFANKISCSIDSLLSLCMLNNGFYYRKSEWRKGKEI